MYTKLAVATDFSDLAHTCSVHMARWAKQLGAPLTIVHVDQDFESGLNDGESLVRLLSEVEATRSATLEALSNELSELGAKVELVRLRGNPAAELTRWVEESGCDLLGLAAQSHRGLDRLVGSTTKRLTRRPPCSLYVVNEGASSPPEAPPIAGRMLYPTDFSEASMERMSDAMALAKRVDATMEVFHVLEMPSFIPVAPGEPAVALPTEFRSMREEKMLAKLRDFVTANGGPAPDYRVTISDSVPRAIAEHCRRYDVDLMVMPTHGHSAVHNVLLGSVAEAMIQLSPVPLLLLPPV